VTVSLKSYPQRKKFSLSNYASLQNQLLQETDDYLELLYGRVENEKQDFRKKFLGGGLVGTQSKMKASEG
jgi:hypothetical protein